MIFKRTLIDLGRAYFHYCNDEKFNLICSKRTLRFSSLERMNDSLETKWGIDLFHEEVNEWGQKNSEIPEAEAFASAACDNIKGLHAFNHTLAVCLSKNGDLLSQWRAYTGDATGFSIGFDLGSLNSGDTHSHMEVLYDEKQQRSEIAAWIDELFDLYRRRMNPSDMYTSCGALFGDLNAYKNPAFCEEEEVRLLRAIRVNRERPQRIRLQPSEYFPEKDKIEFCMRDGIPTPFIDLVFDENSLPIRSVFIGPKNRASVDDIKIYLNTLGIYNVEVTKSKASLR